jgi:hypothetical protein
MPKASHFFLLGGVVAASCFGASSAHAFTIVNHFGQCVEDSSGATEDRNPIISRQCFGLFSQQWAWNSGLITGIGTGQQGDPGTSLEKCLTAFGSADGTPVTLIECQPAIQRLQTWFYLYPGLIFNAGLGKCLNVEDPAQFTQLKVRTCDQTNGNQLFSLRS